MTGRAKWDAWDAAGKKYNATGGAENRYLEIARSLGWTQSVVEREQKSPAKSADVDLEHLSDDDDEEEAPAQSSSAGLGRSVSKMTRPEVAADQSLHDLVLSGDVPGLTLLLDKSPNLDLNALDEYVSEATVNFFKKTLTFLERVMLQFILHATEVIWKS
jgi:hypothetical protein